MLQKSRSPRAFFSAKSGKVALGTRMVVVTLLELYLPNVHSTTK